MKNLFGNQVLKTHAIISELDPKLVSMLSNKFTQKQNEKNRNESSKF